MNKLRKKERKKHQNRHKLFLGAKTVCPDTSKFEIFISLMRLVFELELFKHAISISVFGSEIRIT